MISCKEAVGLNNKIGTCWNIAIQTNLFYGHNSEIVQKKLNEQSVDELLNPTVIENLERFLPPFLVDDTGKLFKRSLDLIKKIVINLKKRFDIKNKQKVTKMTNADEDVCERDFVYYVKELIYPGKRNKEDRDVWGGNNDTSFFLTNILNIILLNKLTHIVKYWSNNLSKGNRISLNIDKIKNVEVSLHQGNIPLDITDLTEKSRNHICQFFECGGTTKYSNNNTIIEHDWRMFFKILNMLSVSDYESQRNNSHFTKFAEYDKTPNPLPKYMIWENLSIGPYIISYDSELKPSIMYSFSPFFKKEKITNANLILAKGQLGNFYFSYDISCTPENIKKIIELNVNYYLPLKDDTLVSVKPRLLKPISTFNIQVKPVTIKPGRETVTLKELEEIRAAIITGKDVRPVNVRPVDVRPVNVRPVNVNVKPKGRNEKCDIVDTLTVAKLNEVFDEIKITKPAAKVLKAERLQILKDVLGC